MKRMETKNQQNLHIFEINILTIISYSKLLISCSRFDLKTFELSAR